MWQACRHCLCHLQGFIGSSQRLPTLAWIQRTKTSAKQHILMPAADRCLIKSSARKGRAQTKLSFGPARKPVSPEADVSPANALHCHRTAVPCSNEGLAHQLSTANGSVTHEAVPAQAFTAHRASPSPDSNCDDGTPELVSRPRTRQTSKSLDLPHPRNQHWSAASLSAAQSDPARPPSTRRSLHTSSRVALQAALTFQAGEEPLARGLLSATSASKPACTIEPVSGAEHPIVDWNGAARSQAGLAGKPSCPESPSCTSASMRISTGITAMPRSDATLTRSRSSISAEKVDSQRPDEAAQATPRAVSPMECEGQPATPPSTDAAPPNGITSPFKKLARRSRTGPAPDAIDVLITFKAHVTARRYVPPAIIEPGLTAYVRHEPGNAKDQNALQVKFDSLQSEHCQGHHRENGHLYMLPCLSCPVGFWVDL